MRSIINLIGNLSRPWVMSFLPMLLVTQSARSEDYGFRYDTERKLCLNSFGEQGKNPGFFGECGIYQKKNLTYGTFFGASLSGSNLRETNLSNAYLYEAKLQGADLSQTDLTSCDLRYSKLDDSVAKDANWRNTFLYKASLRNAQLSGAQLTSIQAVYADFSGANLTEANLSGRENKLNLTRFRGANLSGSDLRYTWISDSDLRDVSLEKANLTGTVLFGTDLTGARVDDSTILTNAKYDEKTKLPFSAEEAKRRGMKLISSPQPSPTPSPAPTPTAVTIQGGHDGKCTPTMVHITKDKTVEFILEAAHGMFVLEIPEFGIELMSTAGKPDKKTYTPMKTGTFPFTCGVHGASDDDMTHGEIMVM